MSLNMSPRKNRPRDPDRARHMVEAAKLIIAFTNGRTFQDFLNDNLLRSAVERQFEILGEAGSHISASTQVLWPSIDWISIKNFRNLLAHEYFRTDYPQVWHIATALLPGLLPTLEALFADLDQQFGPDASV
ncbi:DUF86 domain-containing protein [Hymenobacter sp. RP-2-7]|uniref:DUF86 domain-containing protein n=1 Tax=Hymenobacter polaris TaxID=2682546 RepID=A0A7Y0FNN8_9BACT|nr:HepT-like ribonuclease domain-containing protein [Hymenobacter polaris]NML66720.1 DUF86 domain-containing protein [Hymenobacter polaris]